MTPGRFPTPPPDLSEPEDTDEPGHFSLLSGVVGRHDGPLGDVLRVLGLDPTQQGPRLGFTEATEAMSSELAITQKDGWTALFSGALMMDAPDDGLLADPADALLAHLSADSLAIGFIWDKRSGTFGVDLWRNGTRERLWMVHGDDVLHAEGLAQLKEEGLIRRAEEPGDVLFDLFESLDVPLEALARRRYRTYRSP
jgi:hypothetical protein